MYRPLRLILAVLLAAFVSLAHLASATAAPAAKPAPKHAKADGELVIGSLAPETGAQGTLLDSLRTPVQLAVDEINAAGGVGKKPVRLVTGDEGDSFAVARATFDRMVGTDKVDAIIGPSDSGTIVALAHRIGNAGVLTCSGSDTAAPLTDATSGFYFRTAPPDRLQGEALAKLVLGDKRRRVAILHRDDFYGRTLAAPLETGLEKGHARVVANIAYDVKGTGLADDVSEIIAKKPDAVVLLGFAADGAKAVQALIAAGVGPATLPTYASDGMQSAGFAALVDPADLSKVLGIKGTSPAAAPAVESPFTAALAARNVEPVFSAYSYDCTILTALAAVKAKSDDPAKLKSNFTANLHGKKDCNTFAACNALLAKGKTIHWRGASSKFDRFGQFESNEGRYDIWGYESHGIVITQPATSQIVVP
jgi:ABC-type branched-subunit amino acid transport system substrate-binding protein